MRHLLCACVFVLAGRASARADGIAEEMSAGSAPHAQGAPSSTWIANKLSGMWEPGEAWQLRLDLTGTRYFDASASNAVLANLAVEYDPDSHWILRLAAGGSPSSTADASSVVQAQGAAGVAITADARIATTSSSVSGSASVGYDTAGDGALETSALVSASLTQLDSVQRIADVQGRRGQTVTLAQLQDLCAGKPCTGGLGDALAGVPATVHQLVLGASLSEQLYQHTDVGLDGSYFLYDQDPTQIGSLSLTRAGQASGGNLAIAPVQYSVMPSLIHRFGPLMVMSSVAYSRYIDQQGHDLTGTLRIQYKLALDDDRRVKLWAKLLATRDVDQMNASSSAGALSLGAQYSW
ncbi:MAG: hypothetical protein ABIY55_10860 [Kofleriaceae bacterium]